MLFIGGISATKKDLDFHQNTICQKCGRYSSVSVFMVYSYFSLFFIPLFKWGKKYYAISNCCQMVYSINPKLGQAIERGEEVELWQQDMEIVGRSSQCQKCGFLLTPEYRFCPKCGAKL